MVLNKVYFGKALKNQQDEIWLVVGLGNPGAQYENTRHNAGFKVIDAFCKNTRTDLNKKKFNAAYGETKIGGIKVLAVKPQTFMNNSGEAVGKLLRFYKTSAEKVIIISDDTSLPVGKIRIRAKGSAGGHNGLKSIIAHLSTENFIRVKIGVGEKPHPDYDMIDWVLGKLPSEQIKTYDDAVSRGALAIEEIIKSDIQTAMNRFNA